MDYSIVIPTLNGGATWQKTADAISNQTPGPSKTLVIDSASIDETRVIARKLGFEILQIEQSTFDHGRTRQHGVDMLPEAEIVVFLTQDAVLLSADAVLRLIRNFDDPRVGAAYGRQLAGSEASIFEKHARESNYPGTSIIKSRDSIPTLGIKTAFCSNSFYASSQVGRECRHLPYLAQGPAL